MVSLPCNFLCREKHVSASSFKRNTQVVASSLKSSKMVSIKERSTRKKNRSGSDKEKRNYLVNSVRVVELSCWDVTKFEAENELTIIHKTLVAVSPGQSYKVKSLAPCSIASIATLHLKPDRISSSI